MICWPAVRTGSWQRSMPVDLQGLRVLVTRPQAQADNLAALIEQHGGQAILLPLIIIEPVTGDEHNRALLKRLSAGDFLIFVSANSVRHALTYLRDIPLQQVQIAAIGQATANELAHHGFSVQLVPESGFDTESLLAMPPMQAVAGHRVVIVRGMGGRETLAQTLRARGAEVDYAEVYRRVKPDIVLSDHIAAAQIDVMTITSGEALSNLAQLASAQDQHWIFKKPLVVIHDRIAVLAEQMGFGKQIYVAQDVSDTALVDACARLSNNRSS